MNDTDETLLKEAMELLRKMKCDKNLWSGAHGFTPSHREDVNDLLLRHSVLVAQREALSS